MAPPRNADVLLRMFTTGRLANQLLARELEPAGFSPNQFAVTSIVGALGPITPIRDQRGRGDGHGRRPAGRRHGDGRRERLDPAHEGNAVVGDLWVPSFGGRDVWRMRAP